jgi:hypothetical protein
LFAFTLEITFGPQGLKVMSSIARSLPQPPVLLLIILQTTDVTPGGVVKNNPSGRQPVVWVFAMSFVLWLASKVPLIVSILKVRFGSRPSPLQDVGFKTFMAHRANSYVVFAQRPFTLST